MKKPLILFLFLFLGGPFTILKKPEMGTVTDVDNNVYKTVIIGKYEWMAENLKTTRYNDGTKIPNITSESEWINLTDGAYCWYDNNGNNAGKYGALYNWYAVNTGKLCPEDWRVPTDEDWKYLERYIDTKTEDDESVSDKFRLKTSNAGKHLKANSGWSTGGNGTNKYGFSALPGGERPDKNIGFRLLGRNGFWWSCTEDGEFNAWFRCIIYALDDISRNSHNKKFGFSVRCSRDN